MMTRNYAILRIFLKRELTPDFQDPVYSLRFFVIYRINRINCCIPASPCAYLQHGTRFVQDFQISN